MQSQCIASILIASCKISESKQYIGNVWPFRLTIHVLDVFNVLEGQLKVRIRDKVVRWVHDSTGVRGVGQAQSMAKFMHRNSI